MRPPTVLPCPKPESAKQLAATKCTAPRLRRHNQNISVSRTLQPQASVKAAELKELFVIQFDGWFGMNHKRLFKHPSACPIRNMPEKLQWGKLDCYARIQHVHKKPGHTRNHPESRTPSFWSFRTLISAFLNLFDSA